MDTLAHGLWSVALGKTSRSKIAWWKLALIGAGPDLVWLPFTFVNLITSGAIYFFQGPYNLSHSLVIWLIASLLLMIKWRRIFLWTWPWALHIVIDIPGHLDMYTPIFWPISNKKIPGLFDWLSLQNLFLTYFALGICFAIIFFLARRKKSLER